LTVSSPRAPLLGETHSYDDDDLRTWCSNATWECFAIALLNELLGDRCLTHVVREGCARENEGTREHPSKARLPIEATREAKLHPKLRMGRSIRVYRRFRIWLIGLEC
jgi:hypothetical protein